MPIKYPVRDPNAFKKIDEPWKAYFLGWAYADGCMSSSGGFYIVLAEKDKSVLDYFRGKLYACDRPLFYKKPQTASSKKGVTYLCQPQWGLQVNTLDSDLKALGVVPAKSLILQFPASDAVPPELLVYFLRGYYEGDGSAISSTHFESPIVEILSTQQFLSEVQQILNAQGIYSTIRQREKIYSLKIMRRDSVLRFCRYLYGDLEDMALPRKRDRLRQVARFDCQPASP